MSRRPVPDFVRRIRDNGGLLQVAAVRQFRMVVNHPGMPPDYGHMECCGWGRVVTCLNGVKIGLTLPEANALRDWPCTPD